MQGLSCIDYRLYLLCCLYFGYACLYFCGYLCLVTAFPRPSMKSKVPVLLALLTLHLFSTNVTSGDSPLWGDLEPGPHQVGVRILQEVDLSRTVQATGTSPPTRARAWCRWPIP